MAARKDKFDISVTFAGAPDTSKMNKFSEEDIDRLLSVLPSTKLAQGKAVLIAQDKRDEAVEAYKRELAQHRLLASSQKERLGLSSDKDREAWASSQPKVMDAKRAELDAVIAVKLEEYKYQYLDDLFISARKQANKIEKEIEANMQSARYGNRNA